MEKRGNPNRGKPVHHVRMASNLFVMDSRVPVDPKADPADPSHPENVTKRAIMLQRQAHADGEYDIKAPIRLGPEKFDNPPTKATVSPHLLLLFLVLSIIVGSALIGCAVCFKHDLMVRFALAIGAMCAFRYAASHVPGHPNLY